MAGFHLNFSMVALYETRLSLVLFIFCDGGVVQRNVFLFLIVTMCEKSAGDETLIALALKPVATFVLSRKTNWHA